MKHALILVGWLLLIYGTQYSIICWVPLVVLLGMPVVIYTLLVMSEDFALEYWRMYRKYGEEPPALPAWVQWLQSTWAPLIAILGLAVIAKAWLYIPLHFWGGYCIKHIRILEKEAKK